MRTKLYEMPDFAGVYSSFDTPAISGDGTRIVFSSHSPDLVVGDTNGKQDIFLYDSLQPEAQRLTLISADAAGIPGDADSYSPDISPDGRYIGYVSGANNLRPGIVRENEWNPDVAYYYDTLTGKLTNLGGLQHALYGSLPALSDDGFAYYDYRVKVRHDNAAGRRTPGRAGRVQGAGEVSVCGGAGQGVSIRSGFQPPGPGGQRAGANLHR
ncbi:TolB family protein [Paenibacillus cymbidii]|uniref:TolB family protein n=1 Tax=Paenibacillus cymbidii TaxID=1639034 RepID=UPI0010815334|nr:PD40 domain-containing protein [Paenibacillus cymbidii]